MYKMLLDVSFQVNIVNSLSNNKSHLESLILYTEEQSENNLSFWMIRY